MTAFKARWNGKTWELPLRSELICARNYKRGDSLWLTELEESSPESRGQYFAIINKAWRNMPEQWGDVFPSADALRKWALIRCGFVQEPRLIACDSSKEAKRWRAEVVAQLRNLGDYAEVSIRGNTVVIVQAVSQKMRLMGKQKFQASKQAVMETLAVMLGVTVDQLVEESRKEAA